MTDTVCFFISEKHEPDDLKDIVTNRTNVANVKLPSLQFSLHLVHCKLCLSVSHTFTDTSVGEEI